MSMSRRAAWFLLTASAPTLLLSACGGNDSSVADGSGQVTVVPAPSPSPVPSPSLTPPGSPPPASMELPPAPFYLTASSELPLVGWQQTSSEAPVTADQKGSLAWSSTLKTYSVKLADLASGRLVYSFGSKGNPYAFSVVQPDGTTGKAYATLRLLTANMGEFYWQSVDGATPFIYARALFGLPAGALPGSGRRVFVTDTAPQSSIIVDFGTRKVTGTVTSFNDGGGWDPAGPKEQATLQPADLQPDGTFVATITVAGAPGTGELRGRLYGPEATELGVYWNAAARSGYHDQAYGPWRAVMAYPACATCGA